MWRSFDNELPNKENVERQTSYRCQQFYQHVLKIIDVVFCCYPHIYNADGEGAIYLAHVLQISHFFQFYSPDNNIRNAIKLRYYRTSNELIASFSLL